MSVWDEAKKAADWVDDLFGGGSGPTSPETTPPPPPPSKKDIGKKKKTIKGEDIQTGTPITGDTPPPTELGDSIERGRKVGRERAQALYGMGDEDIRGSVGDIIARRRARLRGESPEDTAMRQQRNQMERQMRAAGRSEGQIEEMRRRMGMDIAREGYRRETGALTDYQRLIGNILGGTTSLEMGFAGLEKAGERVESPYRGQSGLGGGMFGTVICTELFKQGYLSEKIYNEDARYGYVVRGNRPHVYVGYRFLADPVVRLMRKSPVFTWFVALFAVAWARNMAGYNSRLGKLISKVGEPLCGFIGKAITNRRKHAKA